MGASISCKRVPRQSLPNRRNNLLLLQKVSLDAVVRLSVLSERQSIRNHRPRRGAEVEVSVGTSFAQPETVVSREVSSL